MRNLEVSNNNNAQVRIVFDSADDNSLWIENYEPKGYVTSVFSSHNTYVFNTYKTVSSGNKMETNQEVIIGIVTSMSSSNETEHSDTGNQHDLLIYGPSATISMKAKAGTVFSGYIFADTVSFSTPVTVYGAITSLNLQFSNGSRIIGGGACSTPTPSEDNLLTLLILKSAASQSRPRIFLPSTATLPSL
jgi:hypothetical protein